MVAEVGEAGVDAEPRPDDAVGVAIVRQDARGPRPLHARADVVVFAAQTRKK